MVVNNIKKIGIALIILFLHSCMKDKELSKITTSAQTLEEKIYEKVNSFIDSSNCKGERVVAIRYQKYKGKEFIQVSSQNVFITDSLFILKEYKSHILAFYNREFFMKKLRNKGVESENTIKKNHEWNLDKTNFTKTGIPCFNMYELVGKKFIDVPKNSYYYNNLFADPPMLKSPPPPTK